MKEFNEFKNLKFYSQDEQQILKVVSLLENLGYKIFREDFSVDDAAKHGGVCAWDDGEITEGWLDTYSGFKQVTLEELKEMVVENTNNKVLWLNKENLEERWLYPYSCFKNPNLWVKVPEGATFATGDKDNFVFRKDGRYYDNQISEWVTGDVTIQNIHTYEFVKLFWVKGDVKDNIFTLERLLGCEVKINYSGVTGCVVDTIDNRCFLHIYCGGSFDVVSKYYLTFFTEDGDELTFDEYVQLYYPKG